jgi:uncharacterized protein
VPIVTHRQDIVLAGLAPAKGRSHSPVQVQKLFFLIDRNVSDLIQGPLFAFTPYNYGPFDPAVYNELEALAAQGAIEIVPEYTWKRYALTAEGQAQGDHVLSQLHPKARDYIIRANTYVRSLGFTQLVSAIYKAFPETRVNSVFQE